MPEKLEKCVEEVKAGGKSESSAWAICQKSVMGKGDQTAKAQASKTSIKVRLTK